MAARFLTMQDVADELATSLSQIYHMVRSGELPAIKIGGRGQWRIERAKLEEYIAAKYAETAEFVRDEPAGRRATDADPLSTPHDPPRLSRPRIASVATFGRSQANESKRRHLATVQPIRYNCR